jgi:hypothetical protein
MSAEGCVNRQQELRQLEDALQLLRQDPRQDPAAQRLPVITLCGLVGIGKTTLLRQVEQRAQALGLPVLWRSLPAPEPAGAGAGAAILAQLQPALETCLHEQGRAVLLLDDVDPNDRQLLQGLEQLLRLRGPASSLLLVLTAGHPLPWSWEHAREPSRQVLELGPLDPASSALLLERHAPALAPEARALALTWAAGYPLALVVLADALRDGTLDPRQPAARARLLEQLTGRVLRQGVLGALPPEERPASETLLRLLAVPRRFTAMLLQDLIEQFAPEWRQSDRFAYFFLPQQLAARTHALRWQFERAGYVVVAPVRHLLQVLWQEEAPARWREIQQWLAAFWVRRALQGHQQEERVGALLEWSLQRLQLAAPAARAQESQALLAELAAWPWRDPGERQQALALLGQDQELLTTLGEQAAAWQAALRALALQPPPS